MGIFGQSEAGQPRYSGELHNLQVTESVYGTCATIVFGTCRVHGKLLAYAGFQAQKAPNAAGKGVFGGKATEYVYFADVEMFLAQGASSQPCAGLLNVWDQNGKLQNEGGSFAYTIPSSGSATVVPSTSPSVGADLGVFKNVAYSMVANDYGSGGSVTLTGTQQVRFEKVTGFPGLGQYSFNASSGEYTFTTLDAGTSVAINYSTVFSLYYYQQTQAAIIPNSTPWQVSTDNQAFFFSGQSVIFYSVADGNTTGTRVGGTPSAHYQYNQTAGVYTFYSGDAGKTVYINYTYTSSDPNLTNSSTLNLTFFNGAQSQAPWSYWSSQYPGEAFGYSSLCYVGANPLALGESASMPSYNYEIVGLTPFGGGIIDAHPCDALRLLLTDPLLGVNFPPANVDTWTNAYAYWASNNYFISIALDTQQPASQALQQVISTGNVAPVWSSGLLKLVPYGDTTTVGNGFTYTPPTTPVFTLTWDDLLPQNDHKAGETTSDDPIQVSLRAPQDCMNYVQAQWTNRLNDYNNELTPEQNDAFINQYGFRPESPQTWDFITTQEAASWALTLRLKRNCYIRANYKFWLPFWFAALEPMDMVVLPTGEPVRITQIEDDSNGKLSIEAEQFTYGSADVTLYPKQQPTSFQPTASQAVPGLTYATLFEATPQSLLAQPNTIQIALAGNQAAWGGCKIYVSEDGTSYSFVDTVNSLNRIGMLSAGLPSSVDPDTTDTLSVDMTISGGELVSVTMTQADQFVSLSAVVDQAGTMELISFETATLTALNRYDLTYLRRGVYGTAIAAHAVGSEFNYLGSSGIYNYQYPAQYAGKLIYFKFASFNTQGNQLQDLSQCKAYSFTVPGYSLQPPSTGLFSTVPASVITAQASGSTAQITIANFTASLNNQSVSCTVASPITGLNQDQLYYAYYVDLAFQGGAITPIATQNQTDFVSKTGYYSLGSIITPTTGSAIYRPSAYVDAGTSSTGTPAAAYDASTSSYADVSAYSHTGSAFDGDCIWYVFPSYIAPSSITLTVSATVNIVTGVGGTTTAVIRASLDSGLTFSTMLSTSVTLGRANYTLTVPSGTNLNQVHVEAIATITTPPSIDDVSILVYDINIQ